MAMGTWPVLGYKSSSLHSILNKLTMEIIFLFLRLWLLFQSLEISSNMRYHVYYHLVQIAQNTNQIKSVFKDVEHLKQQFAACPPSNEQMQKLLRLLHQALLSSKQR